VQHRILISDRFKYRKNIEKADTNLKDTRTRKCNWLHPSTGGVDNHTQNLTITPNIYR